MATDGGKRRHCSCAEPTGQYSYSLFVVQVSYPVTIASLEDWNRVQGVNGAGVFLCYKYAAKQMIAQGRGGRIIGASSVVGKVGTLRSWYPLNSPEKVIFRLFVRGSIHLLQVWCQVVSCKQTRYISPVSM
jgi:NAD(P)-dependent dehydrogenase (short-subunit alcohol dehydrogenase family)